MSFDVDEVLRALTIEEKAALTIGRGPWRVRPIERLGVPGLTLSDGPHGVRKAANLDDPKARGTLEATCFPTASLLGSTWDVPLVEQVGEALGAEAREMGVDVLLGPGVNIKRTPLCGRNFEYFSEDPLLSGAMGAAWIRGVQSQGVDASVKHFAANNQEHRRFSIDAIVDDRALREIYLPAFRAAVEAGTATVMSAYNRLRGTYATENPWLLTHLLREEWGFEGAVISDWGAVNDRIASLEAGMDLQMPEDGADRIAETVTAVRQGRLSRESLDRAARAVLTLIARADDHRRVAREPVDRDIHHELGRVVGAAGAVLLRNELIDGAPLLPIEPPAEGKPMRIALIGAFASETRYQGSGSSRVIPTRKSNLRDELRERLPGAVVRYVPGYRRHDALDSAPMRQVAVREAAEADLALVVVGLPEYAETEGLDRKELDLPAPHDALVRECVRVNPRTAVVVVSGSAVALPWREEVPAVLQAYLGGQAAGAAIADVLTGVSDPGGRLAETFPIALSDNPVHSMPFGPRQTEYRESIFVGYRWYATAEAPVAYPFGHGLSYTTFEWSDAELSAEDVTADDLVAGRLAVSVTVTNTGKRDGSDVVQVYVSRRDPGIFRASRVLGGFAKVHLEPGASQRLTIEVDSSGFHHWDTRRRDFVIEHGSYEVLVAASVNDPRARLALQVRDGFEPDCTDACRAYRSLHPAHVFSRRAFEELLDEDLPDNSPPRPGEYTVNTPIADMQSVMFGRRLRELIATAIKRRSTDGTVFGGDPADFAMELVPRITLQEGLTPEMVSTLVDAANGDWRNAMNDVRDAVKALAGTPRQRLWRRIKGDD